MPADFDVLVVGSGVAGLMAALTIAPEARVGIITKGKLADGCSRYAQGGIAAAVGPDDSAIDHYEDTIAAGRGLCHPGAVGVLVEEGPERIAQLIEWGVKFDTLDGELELGREAAHSKNRIVHAGGDATGLQVEMALIERLLQSGVKIFEGEEVTEFLISAEGICGGVVCTEGSTGIFKNITAGAVVLASGGASRLWRNSTNPESATGDGISLAYMAGATLAGLEFTQFHPTALAVEGAPSFLLSEALRGEGALVVNRAGNRFLFDFDTKGELAGRDVVARGIFMEMQASGEKSVFLDCRPLGEGIGLRFPTISRTCASYGIDIRKDLVPIAPAAHYFVGGVRTDLFGATDVPGLYGAGEVASSGVHGANRLASNSLLESLVFSRRAALAGWEWARTEGGVEEIWPGMDSQVGAQELDVRERWHNIREQLWRGAGIVRNLAGLTATELSCAEIEEQTRGATSLALKKLHGAALAGQLICQAGLMREESRGCHTRNDFPDLEVDWQGDISKRIGKPWRFDKRA